MIPIRIAPEIADLWPRQAMQAYLCIVIHGFWIPPAKLADFLVISVSATGPRL
ncbi:hypothetical protein CC86DRAFT_154590 [Ophiobolus disseminans]|uniref:Uncharacterized protein n=1 Tax=Ophiobolus disseminans TaxID=1469910 RepID=A0A6A6ZE90_9PLEO|nr:hypothetical protein CC86DRAFT_154590 [Ophiobolus disseminans]